MSTTGSSRVQRLLDDQIEPFLQHLRDAGYAERTLRKKRTVARAFARWAHGKGIATIDLNDGHVDAFVLRLPRVGKSRRKFELAEVRRFLGYLRATVGLQCAPAEAPVSSTASLLQQYENHLRKDRGLAEIDHEVIDRKNRPNPAVFVATPLDISFGAPGDVRQTPASEHL